AQPLSELIERVRDLLAGSGLREVITYSLVGRRLLGRANYEEGSGVPAPLALANPLTPDQEILRTSLLPSLLECVVKNLRPDEGGVRLFEVGRVYVPRQADLPQEREMVGMALAGHRWLKRWGSVDAPLEFADLKGVVEELLDRLHVEGASFERRSGQGFFHPGRAAVIRWRDLRLGAIGELHPAVARNFELRAPAFLAELDIEVLLGAVKVDALRVALPPRFPEIRRDLAVVVEEDVTIAQLLDVIRQAGGPLLVSAELFDLFRGRGVPPGRKSCAFALIFRSPDRTLIDAEVAELEARMIERLERLTGARLRG
ncbi:MAG: phenylalanine--tRNA ligase subunit beta, partial [Candidatus Methylomirabilaceae bacterium]